MKIEDEGKERIHRIKDKASGEVRESEEEENRVERVG